MIANLPTIAELFGHAATWWVLGFALGKVVITFVRAVEQA